MKTCKVGIYVINTQFNEIIEYLHKRGVMEISGKPEGIPEKYIGNIENELKKTAEALKIAGKYKPKKKSLKRRRASLSDYSMNKKETIAAQKKATEIINVEKKIGENKRIIDGLKEKMRLLEDYISLDVPLFSKGTEHTQVAVGEIRCKNLEEINNLISAEKLRVYLNVIKKSKQGAFIWCAYLNEDSERVVGFLKKYYFIPESVASSGALPAEEIERLLKKEKELIANNEQLKKEILNSVKSRRIIELYYDRLMLKKEKYKAAATAKNTEKTFLIEGYVPERLAEEIVNTVEKRFCATVVPARVSKDEVLPTAFSNNGFISPVEEITASYSMPGDEDIDPNPIMAVFYYWFFGMMFSDAGYGLLMMAVCGVLGFSQMFESQKRRIFKMFFWCGVSTTLWGIAYGSFFGDLIATVSKTFGSGRAAFTPILIDPVNQALELLIVSVAFGMVHILTALFIKFYKVWKSGDRRAAVFDVGFWIIILIGISVFAVGMALNIGAIKNTGISMAGFGAAGIVLTGGRDKKNPVMRLFSGILGLYDITGLVGDILSYSRLMALGLATGVIASVVNVLGSLGGNTPLGVVMFVLISVFGHSLNFAINMLGAYVHTNRLQYVEFYQKFYEGGGRRFRPLKMETKYFNFLE